MPAPPIVPYSSNRPRNHITCVVHALACDPWRSTWPLRPLRVCVRRALVSQFPQSCKRTCTKQNTLSLSRHKMTVNTGHEAAGMASRNRSLIVNSSGKPEEVALKSLLRLKAEIDMWNLGLIGRKASLISLLVQCGV